MQTLRITLIALAATCAVFAQEGEVENLQALLSEKEQMIASMFANEDALAEALAVRDEHVAMLECTISRLQDASQDHLALEAQHLDLVAKMAEVASRAKKQSQELTAAEKRVDAAITSREAMSADLKQAIHTYCQLEEQVRELNEMLGAQAGQIGQLNEVLKSSKEELSRTTQLARTQDEQLRNYEIALATSELAYEEKVRCQLEVMQSQIAQIKGLETDLDHAFATAQRKEATAGSLEDELALARKREQVLAEDQSVLMDSYQAQLTQIEDQEALCAALSEQLNKVQGDLAAITEKSDYLDHSLATESNLRLERDAVVIYLEAQHENQVDLIAVLESEQQSLRAEVALTHEQGLDYKATADSLQGQLAEVANLSQQKDHHIFAAREEAGSMREELEHISAAMETMRDENQRLGAIAQKYDGIHEEATLLAQKLEESNQACAQLVLARESAEQLAALAETRGVELDELRDEASSLAAHLAKARVEIAEKNELQEALFALQDYPKWYAEEHQRRIDLDQQLAQLTATTRQQQNTLASVEQQRSSLAGELAELQTYQGSLLQHEIDKRATARTVAAQGPVETANLPVTRIHIVSPGETLATVARQYRITVKELYDANCESIPNQNQVRIGTALVVPHPTS